MAKEIVVPPLGKTVKKAKVAKWHVVPGQKVDKGQVICEVETEKVTFEIEAPEDGVLTQILIQAGKVASVGQTIGFIGEPSEVVDAQPQLDVGSEDITREEKVTENQLIKRRRLVDDKGERIKITPVARRISAAKGIDIALLRGRGPGGRIVKADVLEFEASTPDEAVIKDIKPVLGSSLSVTSMRAIIGERLTQSSRDVPHVYFNSDVDCTALIEFRNIFKPILEKKTGLRLSFNDLLIKAVSMTIEKYPLFNATLADKTIKINKAVDIGLAMALEQGLIVPVLRETHIKPLSQILADRVELVEKAQAKKLTVDDMTGSTFTISNMGQFNIDFFVSIINPPETAILSVAKMKERPVVVGGEVVVKQMMNIGLSADHRVVDGADVARFLQDLGWLLENPFEICSI